MVAPLRPTLLRAAWLLPVAAPPLRDGALLVGADGRIAAVGPRGAVPAPDDAEVVDLGEAALLPGLVDVHAHPELALFRGALEDLPFRDWIATLVRARGVLRDADHLLSARWTMVEALRAGITTLGATEASSAALEALREAGMRGVVFHETFGPGPEQAGASLAGLRAAVERLRGRETERVRVGVSPHAPYTVSDALFRAVGEWAREEGLPLAVHADESAAERALLVEGGGAFAEGLRARGIDCPPGRARSTVELLGRLGVLGPRTLLIHCVTADAEDAARIADAGAAVAHCPVANARLGHGAAPYPLLREAGARVGLGTDSVGSNNRLDLLEEARFASLLQRALHRSPGLLPPDELLRLVTVDGARALGVDDRVGTLEPGKDADLCAVSLAGAHVRPVHDPVAALFHAARGADVVLTAVAGRVLFRGGRVLPLDEAALAPAVEEAAGRLREALP